MGRRLDLGAAVAALAATAVLAGAAWAQGGPAPEGELAAPDDFYEDPVLLRLAELGAADSRVQAHLEHLTQAIGPRLSGSSNLEEAVAWALERFRAFGLEARVEPCGALPVGFDRGPSRGGIVAPERVELDHLTWAWTPGTDGPRRGPARLFPASAGVVDAEPERFRGAWIVWRALRDMPSHAERAEVLDALDALGVAGYVRGGGRERLVMAGDHRVRPDALPTRVVVRVRAARHVELIERVAAGEALELEFDVDNRFRPGPIRLENVVADLVGAERPDEYVIVAAHLDSWDAAEGAQDDGTGVATTLEAARLLAAAGARPRRTIRFVLFSGNEQGFLGSRAYVAAHAAELERTSAVLVHDAGTNYVSGLAAPPAAAVDLERAFRPVMHLDPAKPFEVVVNDGLPRDGGSDQVPFVQAGVPAFPWRQRGSADYAAVHHTERDVLANVVEEYQRHSALVVAIGAYNLARLEDRVSREGLIEPEPRRLGVYLDGTAVTRVVAGPAERAGWRAGDVVVSVDGVPVATREEVLERVESGGSRQTFVLRREGAGELELVVAWGEGEE